MTQKKVSFSDSEEGKKELIEKGVESIMEIFDGDSKMEVRDSEDHGIPLEVCDQSPDEIHIVISDLPGAPPGTPDPEPVIEVGELIGSDDKDTKEDTNEAKSKKNEKWDWSSRGASGFITWIKERIEDVPKHSGYDTAGLERAMSYMEKLDSEISKAMRSDVDGELDASKIEEVRSQIENGIDKIQERLEKVKKPKTRKKKKADFEDSSFVKEGQKILGVQGVVITVPLLISRIARFLINGMVSGGHDLEDMYVKAVKRWKLTDREQAETMQLLADMGYALRRDRGFLDDEVIDVSSSDNFDWGANYKG